MKTTHIRHLFIALSGLWAMNAQASYVNSCELTGTIESTPKHRREYFNNEEHLEVERIKTAFTFKIKTGKPNGRADSGCTGQLGQTINVTLIDANDFLSLHKKQTIHLHVFRKDWSGLDQPILDFQLIPTHK